jgi:DNA-binding SARP family transcriptional activator
MPSSTPAHSDVHWFDRPMHTMSATFSVSRTRPEAARGRQSDALFRSLVTLATAWHRLGDHQLAAVIADSAVDVDSYREVGHRLVIEAECARGDSGAATRALERCERIFADELGVRLSSETLQLAGRLRIAPAE